jgi:hypothetical protein
MKILKVEKNRDTAVFSCRHSKGQNHLLGLIDLGVFWKTGKTVPDFICNNLDDKWVLVATTWDVLRLRMEERAPIWTVAANILNKQSRTAGKGWSSSLCLGEVLTTPSVKTYHVGKQSKHLWLW